MASIPAHDASDVTYGSFASEPNGNYAHTSEARPFSILVLDSNQSDIRLLRLASKWGRSSSHLSFRAVGECEAVLEALSSGYAPLPSIIVLDIEREGRPCLRALKQLKQNSRTQTIPVVVMARPDESALRDAYAAYANCVVPKPETLEEAEALLSRLERFWNSAAVLARA